VAAYPVFVYLVSRAGRQVDKSTCLPVFHKPCTQNTHLGRLKLKLTLVIKPPSFPETQKILLQKDVHIWADTHSNAESM